MSLVTVELFRATPVTSGHITNVLAFASAAAVANLHFLCNQCTLHTLPFADDSDHATIITQGNDLLSKMTDDIADKSMSERPLDFECLHSNGLNFIHLNLLPKIDDLRILAASTKVVVIGITNKNEKNYKR